MSEQPGANGRSFKDEVAGAGLLAIGVALPFVSATLGTLLIGRPLVGLITGVVVGVLVLLGLLGIFSRLPNDVNAGLFMVAVAALGLYLGADYPFGTPSKMGAGFVPKSLCWLLAGVGVLVVGIGIANREREASDIPWRPMLAVLASVLVFALLIEPVPWAQWLPTGLVPAAIASLLVAGLASSETRWAELVVVVIVLALASVFLFIKALGLSLRSGIGV